MMKIMIAGNNKKEYTKVKNMLKKYNIKYKQNPCSYHTQVPAYVFEFYEKDRKKALDLISKKLKSWMI